MCCSCFTSSNCTCTKSCEFISHIEIPIIIFYKMKINGYCLIKVICFGKCNCRLWRQLIKLQTNRTFCNNILYDIPKFAPCFLKKHAENALWFFLIWETFSLYGKFVSSTKIWWMLSFDVIYLLFNLSTSFLLKTILTSSLFSSSV